MASEWVSIGELVILTKCRYSTLKFYTEEGMLPYKQAGEKLIRRYNREKSILQIEKIQSLKKQGYTIAEIKEILKVDK